MQALLAPRPVPDATSFRSHQIKFSMGSRPSMAPSRPSSTSSAAKSLYEEQLTEIKSQLDVDFPSKPRAPPSAQLKAAISGRPSAERLMKTQLSARQREEAQLAALIAAEDARRTQVAAKQLEAARRGHKLVSKSLRERQAKISAAEADLKEQKAAADRKQGEREAALAASVAAAHAELRSQAQHRAERRAKVSERREAERSRLEEQAKEEKALGGPGFNPYLVQRQREVAAQEAKERSRAEAQLDARIAASKHATEAKLGREKALREAQRKAKAAERPLGHVNVEESRPRTLCDASKVELG